MNFKIVFKLLIDFVMTVLLLLLMAFQITGEKAHGHIGCAMFLIFLLHIYMNKMWYKNLFKGRYTTFRTVQTVINFLILFLMISSVFSGVVMIREISTPVMDFSSARLVHLVSVYWGFTFMSVHLGMHWGMISSMIKKAVKSNMVFKILKILSFAAGIYGFYTFIKLDLLSYMFLKSEFVFFDFEQSAGSVLFDYLSIMIFWVIITFYLVKFLITRKNKK